MTEKLAIDTYCIFNGKYDNGFPCRVVCYDNNDATVVVKRLRGGYVGVKQSALIPCSKEDALLAAKKRLEKLK